MKYIFAPHLDDEVIGCYSILDTIDTIIYWTNDYRVSNIPSFPESLKDKYILNTDFDFSIIDKEDIIYLPSKYDYHPLHRKVREFGMSFDCIKMYYSIEMNVPWLEEELDSKGKLELLRQMYPNESLFETNEKYYLFKSVKEYDQQTIISVTSQLQIECLHCWPDAKDVFPEVGYLSDLHRHIFFIEVEKLVTHSNRDIEFILFKRTVQEYLVKKYFDSSYNCCNFKSLSCEQIALELMAQFDLESCTVKEDNENGAKLKKI